MNIRLKKVFKKTSRNVDRALSVFFDPLAEKVGGATNLVVGLMLTIFAVIALFYVFFTNIGFV
ncbi:hypothetical protein HKC17_004821, partial [Salmonella enterica subsp. enterica serovar Typhimurium]|nr:hypothetical protein [Salmonella enterica subsp. enterica serovar Typhimurium]